MLVIAGLFCVVAGAAEKNFHVVLGSFTTEAAAEKARGGDFGGRELIVVPVSLEAGEVTWRLVAGPFKSYAEALREKEILSQDGVDLPWITSTDVLPVPVHEEVSGVLAETESARKEVPVVKDLLGNRILHRRGIPQDLNRSVAPRVTKASLRRYLATRQQGSETLLPDMISRRSNRLSQLQQIQVSEIRLRGSDLLGTQLQALFATYRGRSISTEELLDLKNQANQLFVTSGYINSGVQIPDQQVEDGVIYLDVIEGEVTHVDVNSDLRDAYIRNRLDTRAPFNLKNLQMSLKLLEKNPLVERIHARIVPGNEVGTANVDISVDTAKLYRVGILAANNRSPGIGSEYAELYFSAKNLTSFGDSLSLAVAVTEGMDSYEVDYSIPFNSRDHRLVVSYSRSDSTAIEEPFDAVDIGSLTESAKVGFVLPLIRTPNSEFAVEIYAEKRRNFTSLLGTPFSFSEGAINGESRVAPIRVGASYVHQGLVQSFAGRIVVSRGTSAYNATRRVTGPDGEFTSVLAQLQYSRQLSTNFHITGKLLAQYAADPLMAIERVAIGGIDTVRGYRANQLVRDNVYLASVEGRYRLPFESSRVQLVAFFDWGSGKNHEDSVSSKTDALYSVGIGISVRALRGLSADLYFAHGFEDVNVRNRNLQDDGVHIKLNYEYRF
ncbi:MAG: BamA/TamA family outer membrane protein [Gammaproteobacteria bacterium]|nr:BamA/TamA family outer membrane protein [Gammaproteobacteria bacterium]